MSIDRFLSWFNSTGIQTNYLQIRHSKTDNFGLYVRQLIIEENSLLLSVPEKFFIKPSFENKNLNGFEHLIIRLLEDENNEYIKYLRTIRSIPKWRQFPNENYSRQLKEKIRKHLEKYHRIRNKLDQFDNEQFQWAFYTINTRSIYLDLNKQNENNLCLIPYFGKNSS